MQEIKIKLINDEAWDATLEFAVHLHRCKGAQLGLYLHACRIKIIDDVGLLLARNTLFPKHIYLWGPGGVVFRHWPDSASVVVVLCK